MQHSLNRQTVTLQQNRPVEVMNPPEQQEAPHMAERGASILTAVVRDNAAACT